LAHGGTPPRRATAIIFAWAVFLSNTHEAAGHNVRSGRSRHGRWGYEHANLGASLLRHRPRRLGQVDARRGPRRPVDPSRVDAYLASLGGHARAHFLLHCLAEATAQAVSSGVPWLLLDGYWYKYLAIEIAHGAAEADVTALTAMFPEPALVLYLDVPAAVAVARKTRFSRYESGLAVTPDATTFAAFQAKVRPVLERWAERRGWVRIDGAAEPGVVLESAWRAVRGHAARTKRREVGE
jgi:hypothetical protein